MYYIIDNIIHNVIDNTIDIYNIFNSICAIFFILAYMILLIVLFLLVVIYNSPLYYIYLTV